MMREKEPDSISGGEQVMNTALKQFLHEHAKKHEDGKALVEEWRSAIEHLFSKIRVWLNDSDSDGVIEIQQTELVVSEPGIGRYRVPCLNLDMLGKWVGIIPIARINAGSVKPPGKSAPERATGRIDITDDVRRYVLYRCGEGAQYEWLIQSPINGQTHSMWANPEQKPFDKDAFESALMSLLK
jgi:hypothetical protein